MPDIVALLSAGAGHAWIYLPLAVLLGALHGLEPGHSKSMMAAFIIAVRGTMAQAVVLGVCAAFSHSLVVAAVALTGLYFGADLIASKIEPYLLLVSGVMIIALALWTLSRLLPNDNPHHDHDHHHHDHTCDHDHHHEDEDAHAAAHAREIASRFGAQSATTGQIAVFGLTAGLLPCPAAITVLLISVQLKAFVLGAAMVAAFSIGLACTLVGVGVIAAWGLRHAEAHFSAQNVWLKRLPILSSLLMCAIGLFMLVQGFLGLAQ